jgi:hypothetical protein
LSLGPQGREGTCVLRFEEALGNSKAAEGALINGQAVLPLWSPIWRSSRPATRNVAAQEFFKKKSWGKRVILMMIMGLRRALLAAPTEPNVKRFNIPRYINLEDDFEETVEVQRPKTKVLHSKEIFPVLRDDEFAELHNPQCDTCKAIGHAKERGGFESRST